MQQCQNKQKGSRCNLSLGDPFRES